MPLIFPNEFWWLAIYVIMCVEMELEIRYEIRSESKLKMMFSNGYLLINKKLQTH